MYVYFSVLTPDTVTKNTKLLSFLESLFLHIPYKFHSKSKNVLIIGTMHMCACVNNY